MDTGRDIHVDIFSTLTTARPLHNGGGVHKHFLCLANKITAIRLKVLKDFLHARPIRGAVPSRWRWPRSIPSRRNWFIGFNRHEASNEAD